MCLSFCCCSERENVNCRAIFGQSYEANIVAFMETMPNSDSIANRRKAECMLNKLYEIDSTFVLLNGRELNEFIRENLQAVSPCGSSN